MPRLPFLILGGSKKSVARKLVMVHNVLCFVVYGLFVTAFILLAEGE